MDDASDIRRIFTEKLEKHLYRYYWHELGLKDWKSRLEDRKNEVPRNERILNILESFIGSLRDKRVLIVGSGWGGGCVAAKNLGAVEVIGIDIDAEVNEIANLRMQLEGHEECCVHGAAESIPFGDNSFDYVHCVTVLEHVKNVRESLAEMVRVTKSGGYIFVQAPSYLRPVERHYKIPYLPLMPKWLARTYLKLLKRPANFIDSINYIWPGRVKKLLSDINNIEINQIAGEYKRKAGSPASPSIEYSPSGASPTTAPKRNMVTILTTKATSLLLSGFYEAWDFVFRTNEVYFLIRKFAEAR